MDLFKNYIGLHVDNAVESLSKRYTRIRILKPSDTKDSNEYIFNRVSLYVNDSGIVQRVAIEG